MSGTAIIAALVIATAVAVIAGAMIARQSVATRSLETAQQRAQSSADLQALVAWGRQVLDDDRQRDVLTRLDQPWAKPLHAVSAQTLSGTVSGWIDDEQGKYNLANLVSNGRPDADEIASFRRLCSSLGVRVRAADSIIARVIGSHDLLPTPTRATAPVNSFESGRATSAASAPAPIRATLPMLHGLEDLRSVKDVDARSLDALRDYITFLPATTWVNGNTASAEVLAAQVPGLSPGHVQALIAERDHGRWFINRGDFTNRLGVATLDEQQVRVGITSDWFRVNGLVRRGGQVLRLQALLHRDELKPTRLIWERIGS
ncbi:type II secretion system minor pseudopilin GspK [Pseudomonas huanghezhanensis]|uniref:type II secretion system minor pseudopilin GspK n=1 Tax=Pseudomonas huanghezhanensis TaxID=3002903 RepID=UPI0022854CB8|nr:type II secretion system minor pseudopilin GspK [Pseudomonas sp. BSw22131]